MRLIRYTLLYVVIFLSSFSSSFAQGKGELNITTLNWDELTIDTVLPVYSEVIPLETDYRSHSYQVVLEYPEYAPLSPKELALATKYDSLITDRIVVDTYVGVSRGEGMLDVSFVPIIRRDGVYQKLISTQISVVSTPKQRVRAANEKRERYAAHSKLRSGRWVKISITEDGMYRLTRTALKNMGFSKPENVHLYGYGGHLQEETLFLGDEYDDMVEQPMYYSSSQDAWLFWGNGLLHWKNGVRIPNHYANAAYYFLTETDEPAVGIQSISSSSKTVRNVFTSFPDNILYEKDEFAWYSGGRSLFELTNYANTNTHTYNLTTIDSKGNESLTVVFSAANTNYTKMTTSVNGTSVGTMTMGPTSNFVFGTSATAHYDVAALTNNTPTWNIKLTSTAGNQARLDYIALSYQRQLKPYHGMVAFSEENVGVSRFDIEGTGLQVMLIGEPGSPATLIEGTQNGSLYSVTVDDARRRYVAFDASYAFPQPAFVGPIENQDLHALDSIDMVVIIPTSGKLKAEAQRLVDAHAIYDGLRCAIVRADQIFNEFSSGTPDATAFRRLMKMLYDKAETMETAPRYLLLMGDAAWDNRMLSTRWRKYSPNDYLLCYASENSFSDTKSYVMEDYFALLDDGEGSNILRDKPDIGVGRFPVTMPAEAKIMVDKTITYLSRQNAGAWKNTICFLGDDGDENEHMRFSDDVAERVKTTYPEVDIKKLMWDNYKRVSTNNVNTYPELTSDILKQMKEGALVFNYVGHAGPSTLSHEYVMWAADYAASVTDMPALWMTAACETMPFDGLLENIGENAVLNPNGGALAFYGTARTVYASQNLYMNRYFSKYLFGKSAGRRNRVGDAIRLAKNSLISDNVESAYRENKLQYALLGDPSLMFGEPEERVILDSINGTLITSTSKIPLKAGQHVKLSGHINNASGATIDTFRGIISTKMFDNEEYIVCRNNDDAETAFRYLDRNGIYNSLDSVRNGRFEVEFIIPVDINYSNKEGRFSFYALNDERTMEANGYCQKFTLGGIADDLGSDTQGPEIAAYLNSEDFQSGDVVNSTPFFVAHLQDESGINYSGSGIGHDLLLCVDGDADKTYVLNNNYVRDFGDYTHGTASFLIPALEEGPHTVTFRAWDVLNNTNSVSLDFVVDRTVAPTMLALSATQNPATTSTTFLVSYDMAGSECSFRLEVFDFSGRRVWYYDALGAAANGVYAIPWNLCNNAGGKLGSGIYFYRCQMQCGESKTVSKTQKIVVLNNK